MTDGPAARNSGGLAIVVPGVCNAPTFEKSPLWPFVALTSVSGRHRVTTGKDGAEPEGRGR
jgi:hypothetical protein